MKMTNKVLTVALGIMVAGPGFAGCPSNLDVDQLVECITVEGSGSNYQKWQKKHAKLSGDSDESYASSSKAEKVASTITAKAPQAN